MLNLIPGPLLWQQAVNSIKEYSFINEAGEAYSYDINKKVVCVIMSWLDDGGVHYP